MAGFKRAAQAAADGKLRPITLGDLAERGIDVFCWCNRCHHHAVLASGALVARLGPQFAVPEIGGQTRCTACGARDVATRPDWPSLGQVARHGGAAADD